MEARTDQGPGSMGAWPAPTSYYYLGLDLGQAQDYTAICVAERLEPPSIGNLATRSGASYQVRHLERCPLGTPYPRIVARVLELVSQSPLQGAVTIVADATGVGAAVIDLLRDAPVGAPLHAVTITGGDTVAHDGLNYRVPKRDLVGVLQVLLQSERLKVAQVLPEAGTLVRELLNFRVTINANAHDSYAAWREGVHDDLVLATALACWTGEHQGVSGVEVVGVVRSGTGLTSRLSPESRRRSPRSGWVEINGRWQPLPWDTP